MIHTRVKSPSKQMKRTSHHEVIENTKVPMFKKRKVCEGGEDSVISAGNIAQVVVKDEEMEGGQYGEAPAKVEATVSMAEVDVKEAVEKSVVAANTKAKKASKGSKGKIQTNTLKAYFTSQKRTTPSVELDGGGAAGGESELKQTEPAADSSSAGDNTGVG